MIAQSRALGSSSLAWLPDQTTVRGPKRFKGLRGKGDKITEKNTDQPREQIKCQMKYDRVFLYSFHSCQITLQGTVERSFTCIDVYQNIPSKH